MAAPLIPGLTVRINPGRPFAGLLATVREVRPWGVIARIPFLDGDEDAKLSWDGFTIEEGAVQ